MPKPILKIRAIPESARVPLALEFAGGEKRTFQLAFDASTLIRIEERSDVKNAMNPLSVWAGLSISRLVVIFWAAVATLDHFYDSDEGLITVRSFLTQENIDDVGEAAFNAHLKFVSPRQRIVMEELLRTVKENMNPTSTAAATEDNKDLAAATTSAVSQS